MFGWFGKSKERKIMKEKLSEYFAVGEIRGKINWTDMPGSGVDYSFILLEDGYGKRKYKFVSSGTSSYLIEPEGVRQYSSVLKWMNRYPYAINTIDPPNKEKIVPVIPDYHKENS